MKPIKLKSKGRVAEPIRVVFEITNSSGDVSTTDGTFFNYGEACQRCKKMVEVVKEFTYNNSDDVYLVPTYKGYMLQSIMEDEHIKTLCCIKIIKEEKFIPAQ